MPTPTAKRLIDAALLLLAYALVALSVAWAFCFGVPFAAGLGEDE